MYLSIDVWKCLVHQERKVFLLWFVTFAVKNGTKSTQSFPPKMKLINKLDHIKNLPAAIRTILLLSELLYLGELWNVYGKNPETNLFSCELHFQKVVCLPGINYWQNFWLGNQAAGVKLSLIHGIKNFRNGLSTYVCQTFMSEIFQGKATIIGIWEKYPPR